MMNEHPIKFEFVEAENLLASDAEQLVVIADDKKTDSNEFLIDLIQKIFPEYRFPATNWGAFTDYLCDLDEESRPNTVIAHSNLPKFIDPQQIDHYIKCLGEALVRWRSNNPKNNRLIVRFLKQDEDYVVKVMNEDWKTIINSPYFDPNRYGL
jgi:hypothetical protein